MVYRIDATGRLPTHAQLLSRHALGQSHGLAAAPDNSALSIKITRLLMRSAFISYPKACLLHALGLAGLIAFFWALKRGQFEDLDGAANRILYDDEEGPHG